MTVLEADRQYILNCCTKYLARDNTDSRHNFGQYNNDDLRARVCESWRFPIVDSYSDGVNFEACYALNQVTFVYVQPQVATARNVAVVGTFANLYEPIPLTLIPETNYFSLTVVVPKGETHTYKFIVDGQALPDPLNPQRVVLDNGRTWSRFFTHLASDPISFERWELAILNRITDHILPFQTAEGRNFLARFYDSLDKQAKETQYAHAYRLDQPIGASNFIDKLVAKEENHHLIDYKICLEIIDRLLRERNPFIEPSQMSREMYSDLYNEMATGNVPGWNYNRYSSPQFFLQLLRRHVFTGAFSHPKYGGNIAAAGWAYLEEKYQENGHTLFDWRRIMEKPLGDSADYRG